MTDAQTLMLLAVVIAIGIAGVVTAIIWPMQPLFDAMDHPFGDVPTLHPEQREVAE